MQHSPSAYGWLMLAGIAVSLVFWVRLARRDSRLIGVYAGGLVGAMFGAKLVFLLAEGWLYFHEENRWMVLATGKSIVGALLGGYAGVEIAKRMVGYRAATGDRFALVAPIGILFGRIGCMLHGCCLGRPWSSTWFAVADFQGVARWPAARVEFVFNLVAFVSLAICHRKHLLANQLFHVYLIAYGLFRFVHEFYRDTPRIFDGISGYQIAALAVFSLGCAGFWIRERKKVALMP
jgi:phosphatidylglycerol:prolipoprotein diacylglycerol transferase